MFSWINEHRSASPAQLRLKYHGRTDAPFSYSDAILQIECRQRFGKKISDTLQAIPEFYFPTELSGEQATSDALAEWHSSLIGEGWRIVDLTAGLGIDALHCAKRASSVIAVDINPEVAEALRRNVISGKIENIEVVTDDCRHFIEEYKGKRLDAVFIDPARRADDGGRVYSLADCAPNVVKMLSAISRISRRLIIKASPMLDISHTLSLLPGAERIVALGTATECKELVILIDFDNPCKSPIIQAVTIGHPSMRFTMEEERDAELRFVKPEPGMWLYEPYPTVMKAAPFKLLCERFCVGVPSAGSHIYLSPEPIEDFPGIGRRIVEVVEYASKNIKRFASHYPFVDVATRCFPISAAKLATQLKVKPGKPGGPRVVGAISDNRPVMIVTQ